MTEGLAAKWIHRQRDTSIFDKEGEVCNFITIQNTAYVCTLYFLDFHLIFEDSSWSLVIKMTKNATMDKGDLL